MLGESLPADGTHSATVEGFLAELGGEMLGGMLGGGLGGRDDDWGGGGGDWGGGDGGGW